MKIRPKQLQSPNLRPPVSQKRAEAMRKVFKDPEFRAEFKELFTDNPLR